ncbi:TIGR02391 family protein [Paraburkholderia tropica]
MSDYFSDRQNGPWARIEQVILPAVWAGGATVQTLINSGAFGLRFPERCPDGQATCGGDADDLGGFRRILIGAHLGIRNLKAHSLNHDLDLEKAGQYLIFASLLARRIYEAKPEWQLLNRVNPRPNIRGKDGQ